jgi:hypothetical protein
MFLIEDENILNEEEKNLILNTILGNNFPFYWNSSQVYGDSYPFFNHALLNRNKKEVNSSVFEFFFKILLKFCNKHSIQFKKIYRGSVNLLYPIENVKIGTIHKDHDSFSHKQFILYLSNPNNGHTHLYNEKKELIKTIEAKQFKAVCFNDCNHAVGFPDKDRRVIVIFTFNDN